MGSSVCKQMSYPWAVTLPLNAKYDFVEHPEGYQLKRNTPASLFLLQVKNLVAFWFLIEFITLLMNTCITNNREWHSKCKDFDIGIFAVASLFLVGFLSFCNQNMHHCCNLWGQMLEEWNSLPVHTKETSSSLQQKRNSGTEEKEYRNSTTLTSSVKSKDYAFGSGINLENMHLFNSNSATCCEIPQIRFHCWFDS